MSFSVSNDGRKEFNTLIIVIFFDQFAQFLLCIFTHNFARYVGVGLGSSCVKKAQEVIDLRYGSYRGACIIGGCFLFDGNHGTQSLNGFHIGTAAVTDETTRVGRKSFYVTPLSFCQKNIENKGRFAAAAKPCNHS